LSTQSSPADSRHATAERNLRAILDGAERLLERGEQPSISAVANEAGVSRPTVYAHFQDRPALLAAVVARTVREATEKINSAEPTRGPPREALARVIAASWQQVASHDEIGRAAAAELSGEAMRSAHESARGLILELVERGRDDGSFRTDVPANWLASAAIALVHATADEVRMGHLDADGAPRMLARTFADLFGARDAPR
jgi:AcrR family transcriptional regulator